MTLDLSAIIQGLQDQVAYHRREVERLETAINVLQSPSSLPTLSPPPAPPPTVPTLGGNGSKPQPFDEAGLQLARVLKGWGIRYPVASSYVDDRSSAHAFTRQILKNAVQHHAGWPALRQEMGLASISDVKTASMLTLICQKLGIDTVTLETQGESVWNAIKTDGRAGVDYIVRPAET